MRTSVTTNVRSICVTLWLLLAASSLALAQQPVAQPSPGSQSVPGNEIHARVTETLIDSSIPDDPAVDKLVAVYSPKVHELDSVIGELKGELRKGGIGAGSLGNFVTDAISNRTSLALGKPVAVAVTNAGGLRRPNITEGPLRGRDIWELLPFENAIVTVDVTGQQLLKLLEVVVASHDAQSGARLTYITKSDKSTQLEKAVLIDASGHEKEINPNATYTVATIDYLYNVGGRYAILRDGANMKPLGIVLRNAVIDYVNAQTAAKQPIRGKLDNRFILDKANSVITDERPPDN